MWAPHLDRRRGPIAAALADAVADAVQGGRLAPGDRLPPQRDLADALGIAVTTVTRGYDEAERRGLVAGEVGRGTFVRAPAFRRLHRERDPDVIDLSLNTLLPHAHAAELVARFAGIAGRLPAARLLDYQPHAGGPEMRAAAADWLRRAGLDVAADDVVITAGAQHGLAVVFGALCSPGDEVLVEGLTYPGIKAVASFLRLRLRPVPLDREGLQPDALESASVRGRARLLYCMPNVQNPTGVTAAARRRRDIVDAAGRAGLTIVEDDSYGFLVDGLPLLTSLAPERCVYVTGLSKSVAPGLRVGVVRPPRHAVSRLTDLIFATTVMAPPATTEVAADWMTDGTADRIVKWKRSEVKARAALARRHLRTLQTETPTNSPHVWLQLPPPWRADDFARAALARGVVVTPARAFAVGREVPEAIRVCLGAAPDRQVMVRAVKTLDALAADHQSGFSSVV
jgi:DNA-binding transcriptional MocR family regulator